MYYSDQRCKSRLRLIFNYNFYMYFGYSLNKGMLKALGSFPFLLILSHFIQITMYNFIQFSCSKHQNPNARIRWSPVLTTKATPTHTDTFHFFCMPILCCRYLYTVSSMEHGLVCCSSASWEDQKEWRKRINETGWPLCHYIHFSGHSSKEKLSGLLHQ